ncbi:MAG: FAD-dependent oxidoreductase [Deltaproteobacteria bacterium]|nr:MAG: FAD-dependent oxidoreductase [Deltaproteobacteria bacterium]
MRLAVIGTGISGMVAAYLLCEEHDLVVFEANDYMGGHTNTCDVEVNGSSYAVDTGFIVFNKETYPNFVKLMKRLGVAWHRSNMSFSVQSEQTGLEYSPSTLNSLFAQRKNLLRPSFYRMLLDVFRFRREAQEILEKRDYHTTLGDYLESRRYSQAFIHHFIIPMGGAIWSADPKQFNEFPTHYFVQFFNNHGFLKVRDQPVWQVITGGSRNYVKPLTKAYRDKVRLSSPVERVRRHGDHVEVKPLKGDPERFDQVIIATHSDQALAMLADPTDAEREILSAIPYQENLATLHIDASLLPRKRAAWASWNYHIPAKELGRVAVTYYMNMLQSLRAPEEFCVTLNQPEVIDPKKIIREFIYHHPVYTHQGPLAQERRKEINGTNRTYFCGAYWGYGFHEDGVNSALAVCKDFGKTL